ncbi:hypothetical protein [Burkholderia sp. Ac-20353]|uniref:hypothetical protein n=1 Tax=Burkholderia sp. Ac-20353 TaxID=2703894 RepID=UPI00197B370B|nr:hypothetical protein [Burkholderia sp. Ac-20353]MBN3791222.1 hypothetical protein [Burkholderia sp. Ac-20353]
MNFHLIEAGREHDYPRGVFGRCQRRRTVVRGSSLRQTGIHRLLERNRQAAQWRVGANIADALRTVMAGQKKHNRLVSLFTI